MPPNNQWELEQMLYELLRRREDPKHRHLYGRINQLADEWIAAWEELAES